MSKPPIHLSPFMWALICRIDRNRTLSPSLELPRSALFVLWSMHPVEAEPEEQKCLLQVTAPLQDYSPNVGIAQTFRKQTPTMLVRMQGAFTVPYLVFQVQLLINEHLLSLGPDRFARGSTMFICEDFCFQRGFVFWGARFYELRR